MSWRHVSSGVLALTVMLIHIITFVALIAAHPERILEVDSLNVTDISRSILSGVPVTSWQFPPSPYLIPEVMFHLPIAWLIDNVVYGQFVHAYLLSLGFLVTQLILLRYIVGSRGISVFAFVILVVGNAFLGTRIDHSIISPMYHFGTFVSVVIGMLLLERVLFATHHWFRWVIGLSLLSCSLVLSDWMFVGWFTLPSLVYVGLAFLLAGVRFRRIIVVVAVLLISILLVRLVPYILPNAFPPQAWSGTGFSHMLAVFLSWADSIARFVELFIHLVTSRWWVFFYLVVGLFSLCCIPRHFTDGQADEAQGFSRGFRLSAFVAIIIAVNIFVIANHDQAPVRYLIPVYYLPVAVFLIGLTAHMIDRISQPIQRALIVVALGMGSMQAYGALQGIPKQSEIIAAAVDIDCFEGAAKTYDLNVGITDHLMVRKLNLLANTDARLYQIYGGGLQKFWFQSSNHEYPDRYDFAVVNTVAKNASGITRVYYYLNESLLESRAGPPDMRVFCKGYDILVYHKTRTFELEPEFCHHAKPCG